MNEQWVRVTLEDGTVINLRWDQLFDRKALCAELQVQTGSRTLGPVGATDAGLQQAAEAIMRLAAQGRVN